MDPTAPPDPTSPPNPYIMPVGPPANDPTQIQARQARLKQWQAQNPGRVQREQMGRDAGGGVNYDSSIYGARYQGSGGTISGVAGIGNVTSPEGKDGNPLAFNGADPRRK